MENFQFKYVGHYLVLPQFYGNLWLQIQFRVFVCLFVVVFLFWENQAFRNYYVTITEGENWLFLVRFEMTTRSTIIISVST